MRRILIAVIGGTLTLFALGALSEEHETPERYIYATYFRCEGAGLDRVDEIVADGVPVLHKLVDDGTIRAWGWLAHHTGGPWRRLQYFMSDSIEDLLADQDAITKAQAAAAGDDDQSAAEFAAICPHHEDYIWVSVIGMTGEARGDAGMSVYHVCDITREDRADEIVKEHFAPVMDKLVEQGKLTSWGFAAHVVGGKYRKLQTMTAKDHATLLAARGEAIEAIYGDDNVAGAEFTDICGPHADYLWDIQHERP